MNSSYRLLRRLYKQTLRLYPPRFQQCYEDQLLLTLDDAWRDRRILSAHFWLRNFADLLHSALKERLLMLNERIFSRAVFSHAIILGIVFSLLGAAATMTVQQMLRRGADQPQTQMASFYAAQLTSGIQPLEAIPRNSIDLEHSLEPFVIVYDDRGHPIASTGYLHQVIPAPPQGVFNHVRIHGLEKVTWQPQPHVRIASIVRRTAGPTPGFILAGRSLELVERQENTLYLMAFSVWFCVVALLAFGARFLGRAQRLSA